MSPGGAGRARRYHWPGNVRELENVIERARRARTATCSSVERAARVRAPERPRDARMVDLPKRASTSRRPSTTIERRYLQAALDRTGGVQTQAPPSCSA